ncbi:class A sortase [Aerococcaceae bacterium WGS1372]
MSSEPRTRREARRRKQKSRKGRGSFRTVLGVLLILVAVALLAIEPAKNFLIQRGSSQNSVSNLTREQIESNQLAEVTYNWEDINTLSAGEVLASSINPSDLPTIGGMAMPELGMNLPIYKGVSNEGMFYGAGTLYEDQEMGVSNYSLASHHSINEGLLFEPLMRAQIGQTIYLTDLENIYVYEVDYIDTVPATAVEVTYPTQEARITLITCDTGLVDRVIVQGKLVDTVSVNDASPEMLEAFEIDQTITS